MKTNVLQLVACVAVVIAASCGDDGGSSVGDGGASKGGGGGLSGGVSGGGATSGVGGTAAGGGATAGTGGFGPGGLVGVQSCATSGATACYDGVDNDKDGRVDLADPECTGPCDNDEASFGTGISGDNVDACKQDCFFDGNSGQGDDGCEWNLKCDSASPGANLARACPYDAGYKNCPKTQSEKCVNNCRRVTPNGCDCFGCCAIPSGNTSKTVILASGCTADKLNDPKVCAPCTQNTACVNTCEKCELCIGKTTLPADCKPATPAPTPDGGQPPMMSDGGAPVTPPAPEPVCDETVLSCGVGGDVAAGSCAGNTYCITGCCILPIL